MGRKGVSKRKPQKAKSETLSEKGGRSSVSPVSQEVKSQSAKSFETGKSDFSKSSTGNKKKSKKD